MKEESKANLETVPDELRPRAIVLPTFQLLGAFGFPLFFNKLFASISLSQASTEIIAEFCNPFF